MAVETNVSPYFDDYDEDKGFHRILFKPGVAVQSRELTQSQTILQNQIKRVGDYLFKDGDKVKGPKPSVDTNARTIRLNLTDELGDPINVQNFANTWVTSATSNIIGKVEFTFDANDPDVGDATSVVISLKKYNTTNDGMFDSGETLWFYNSYTDALNLATEDYSAVVANDETKNAVSTTTPYSKSIILTNPSSIIEVGDLVTYPSITKKIYVTEIKSALEIIVSEAPGVTISGETISYVKKGVCPTLILTQDDSYFYKSGFFVKCRAQRIVPDKNTSYPSRLISLISDQEIITSNDDESLLDPALGSSNYFASGADRLKIGLSLTSLELNSDGKASTTEDFIPLLKFNKGEIEYLRELTGDGVLEAKLAERTYDESGSYTVKPFLVTPVNNGSLVANNYVFSVSAGKAYVGGHPVSTVGPTEILVPKASTLETKTGYNITTSQGNYLKVSNVRGKIPKIQEFIQGERFMELHNVRYPANANTRVGYVALKNLEYESSLGRDTAFKFFFTYYSTEKETTATWENWGTKYNISVAEGQYIANVIYYSNDLFGYYGASNVARYGLFREPDTVGLAWAHGRWVANGKDIAKLKETFVGELDTNSAYATDRARSLTNVKTYSEVINNSPFYDGLENVNRVRSIVGANNSFTSHYTAATYASPFFYADIHDDGLDVNGDIKVIDPRPSDALVFKTGKSYLQTVDNLNTLYNEVKQNAVFASGTHTITLSVPNTFALGDGTVVASTARVNFTVLIKSGNTANTALGVFNFERGSVTIQGDSATAVINLSDTSFNGIADISYVVETSDASYRSKTLVPNQYKIINAALADYQYSIGYADIFLYKDIYKITPSSFKGAWSSANTYSVGDTVFVSGVLYQANTVSTNVYVSYGNAWGAAAVENLKNYTLSTGQTDTFYDHGYIKYIGPSASIPGNILVSFSYFTHSGTGPITVNSYESNLYSLIPTYNSVIDSKTYVLRDCLDFRPRRQDNSSYYNYDAAIFPTSSVNTEADVTYYLGRKDRLYVTNTLQNFDSPYNKFYLDVGSETINPTDLLDQSDLTKLSICTLDIPPFGVSGLEVKIVYDDNRRFTMKDIAKIQKTTIALDKQIKLHTVEIANLKSTITNAAGDVLLKSGIFVDDFSNLDKADLAGGQFSAVINETDGTCFPLFSSKIFNFNIITPDEDIQINNDLITMKYVEDVFASQLEANNTINPNPGGIDDGRGRSALSDKNSFAVNLFLTGGLLISGYIAAQVVNAYSTYAALTASGYLSAAEYLGFVEGGGASFASVLATDGAITFEGVLATAWAATRELGQGFIEAISNIDSLSGLINSGQKAIESAAGYFTSFISGGSTDLIASGSFTTVGASSVLAGAYPVWGASAGSYLATSYTSLSSTIGAMVSGEISIGAGAVGVVQGVSGLYNAIGAEGFSLAISGANSIATATSGTAIAEAATWVSEGLSSVMQIPYGIGPALATIATIYVASKAVDYILESPENRRNAAVAGGVGYLVYLTGWGCFAEDSYVLMASGEYKKISECNAGDYIFNHDKTQINQVKFVFINDEYLGSLYSLEEDQTPFMSFNHPIYKDGKLSSFDAKFVHVNYPWLGKTEQIIPAKQIKNNGKILYNLFVDGDGTYTVNDVGVNSVMGDGGILIKFVNENKISKDHALEILKHYHDAGSYDMHTFYNINNGLAEDIDSQLYIQQLTQEEVEI